MSKDTNPFKAMMAARQGKEAAVPEVDEPTSETKAPIPEPEATPSKPAIEPKETEPPQEEEAPKKRKRGRPATGKRSDPDWIGRTYYVQESTDIDVELELAMLRRQGVEKDKSALVDSLLSACVKWRNGEDSEFLLSEISQKRKDK